MMAAMARNVETSEIRAFKTGLPISCLTGITAQTAERMRSHATAHLAQTAAMIDVGDLTISVGAVLSLADARRSYAA